MNKNLRGPIASRVAMAMVVTALCVLAVGAVPAPASGQGSIVKLGTAALVDIPAGFGAFSDVSDTRAGTQVNARVRHDGTTLSIVDDSSGALIGSAALAGFVPKSRIEAGYRIFVWGKNSAGAVRLWTPAFDGGATLSSIDPDLTCTPATDATTPIASANSVDIPAGYSITSRTFVDTDGSRPGVQVDTRVFGSAADPTHDVRVMTTSASELGGRAVTIGLRRRDDVVVKGGFAFAHAVFAFGTGPNGPLLWTPILHGSSRKLVRTKFMACTPPSAPSLDSIVVTSAPDTGRAATNTISARFGGTVDAEAADGTHFHLQIPPGALGADTAITITPTTASGLDTIATSSDHGIEFAPAGLVFNAPATLVVTPPSGSPSLSGALWVGWSSGPGVDLRSAVTRADGSVEISIPHFSGVTSITAVQLIADAMVTLYLAQIPTFGSDAALQADLAGLFAGSQGALQRVVDDLYRLYLSIVDPAISQSGVGSPELGVAVQLLVSLQGIMQTADGRLEQTNPSFPGLGSFTPGGSSINLQTVFAGGTNTLTTNGVALYDHFTPPKCDATATFFADWAVEVVRLAGDLATLNAVPSAPELCYGVLANNLVDLPPTPQPSQVTLPYTVQAFVTAPSQTQEGTPQFGKQTTTERTRFLLHVDGATFPNGTNDLDVFDDHGTITTTLDRGANAASNTPVTVSGIARLVGDFGNALVATNQSREAQVFATTRALHLHYSNNPPVNRVLALGELQTVCVTVTDEQNHPIDALGVGFVLDGPGSLSIGSTSTVSNGVACTDYHAPAGPVSQGDTATITADAVRGPDEASDAVTLTPQWAELSMTAFPSTGGVFNATNTTITVKPNATVTLDIGLLVAGVHPSDPGVPSASDIVSVDLTSGPGNLASQGAIGSSVYPVTDSNGHASVVYDPAGQPGDATIRVGYPGLSPSIAATVVIIRTPLTVRFVAPTPIGAILPAGGSSQLCARVTDSAGGAIGNRLLFFDVYGPGAQTDYSATTDTTGTACIGYNHPHDKQPPGTVSNAFAYLDPNDPGHQSDHIQLLHEELPLVVNTNSLPTGVEGLPYSPVYASSSSAGPVTWTASGLAPGLTIGTADGQIRGTPSVGGTYSVTLTATSATQTASSLSFQMTILAPVTLTGTINMQTTASEHANNPDDHRSYDYRSSLSVTLTVRFAPPGFTGSYPILGTGGGSDTTTYDFVGPHGDDCVVVVTGSYSGDLVNQSAILGSATVTTNGNCDGVQVPPGGPSGLILSAPSIAFTYGSDGLPTRMDYTYSTSTHDVGSEFTNDGSVNVSGQLNRV